MVLRMEYADEHGTYTYVDGSVSSRNLVVTETTICRAGTCTTEWTLTAGGIQRTEDFDIEAPNGDVHPILVDIHRNNDDAARRLQHSEVDMAERCSLQDKTELKETLKDDVPTEDLPQDMALMITYCKKNDSSLFMLGMRMMLMDFSCSG